MATVTRIAGGVLFPGAVAIIEDHLKRKGWTDDKHHPTLKFSSDDIPDDLIEEFQFERRLPPAFRMRIITAMLPRRYWNKKPDPAKLTRWRRGRLRAGL